MPKYYLLISNSTPDRDNLIIAQARYPCKFGKIVSCFNKPDYKCSSKDCVCSARYGLIGMRYEYIHPSNIRGFICEGACLLLKVEDDNNG